MLQWTEPLRVATQLQIPVTDAQKTLLDPTRKTLQIFRAMKTFQHAPAFDNVKVLIENRNGVSSCFHVGCKRRSFHRAAVVYTPGGHSGIRSKQQCTIFYIGTSK